MAFLSSYCNFRQELENTHENTVIITMGAGNIYEVGESLADKGDKG